MTLDLSKLAHAGVRALRPYEPGKPIDELERELGVSNIVKLASNENPLGPSKQAIAALQNELAELNLYPDGNAFNLKQALSRELDIAPAQLTIGNGSSDILDFVLRAFVTPEHEVMFAEHAFAMYPILTRIVGARPVMVPARNWGHDLEAMADAITNATRVVFIANPNNPTGTWLTRDELTSFLDRIPVDVLVVLDEAYFEYVEEPDYPNGVQLVGNYPNLVVTRTFSKVYGLAGLRIGYGVSSAEMADYLNRVRPPFNANQLALVAAEHALKDTDHLRNSIELNRNGMKQLVAAFEQLGIEQIPSVGNFISAKMPRSGMGVFEALLREGVIVRPVDNYGMQDYLRVTIGTKEENDKFISALKKVLAA
ncbi:MAG: histidinol-phosphate transaminase [Acidiferrobacterales bacterium]